MSKSKTVRVENIEGYSAACNYNAEIVPGQSIRIWGTYGNHIKGPQTFDRTSKIGDAAEYDSYNLKYIGNIVRIGPKTVKVKHYEHSATCTQLTLEQFIWRNWDLDLEKTARENAETMQCI